MGTQSEETKKEAIQLLLKGYGYVSIARKLGISEKTVRNWVEAYNDGRSFLKSLTRKSYSPEFKLKVIEYRWENRLSFRQTANKFGINNIALIANWQKRYLEEGFSGLIPKPKGRRSMNKKADKEETIQTLEQQTTEQQRIRELEVEVASLRRELSFWKAFKKEVQERHKSSRMVKKK